MAGGFGLSRVLQGTVDGIDKGMARRDMETQRQRSKTSWDQQQDDRNYSLNRREVSDKRSDAEYSRSESSRIRNDDVNKAMNLLMQGNAGPANEVFNKYSDDDTNFELTQNDDGTFTSVMSYKGKKSEPKIVSADEAGSALVGFKSDDNPFVRSQAKQNAKAEKGKIKDERQFKREQAKTKHGYNVDLEKIKQSNKTGSNKSSKEYKKQLAAASKEHRRIAVQNYGKLFEGMFSFGEDDIKENMANNATMLGDAIFAASDNPNIAPGTSGSEAYFKMEEFRNVAVKQAMADKEKNGLDDKKYEKRVVELINYQTKKYIKDLSKDSGNKLSREDKKGGAVSESGYKTKGGKVIPLKAIERLKKGLSGDNAEAYRKGFLEQYKISADEVLKGRQIADPANKAPVSTSSSGSPGLVREANASEDKPVNRSNANIGREKPKKSVADVRLAGKERSLDRKEKIKQAKLEYRTKWKGMADDSKIKWLKDNGALLKSVSPSSYRNAEKDVRKIKSKKRFSPEGKKAYELMRENRKYKQQ